MILRGGEDVDAEVLRSHVAAEIGAIAKPKQIYITPDLPKTRSGKIMRRLLRDVAEGRNIGDTTTLADASIVDELQAKAAAERRRLTVAPGAEFGLELRVRALKIDPDRADEAAWLRLTALALHVFPPCRGVGRRL